LRLRCCGGADMTEAKTEFAKLTSSDFSQPNGPIDRDALSETSVRTEPRRRGQIFSGHLHRTLDGQLTSGLPTGSFSGELRGRERKH